MKDLRVVLVAVAALFALLLTGCSGGGHQVINNTDECPVCHSEEKALFDVASPANAFISPDGVVTVTIEGYDGFSYSPVVFTSNDGSSFVPYAAKTMTSSAGTATSLTLPEGVWAINAGPEDGNVSQLVIVDPSATSNFDGSVILKP